MTKVLIVGSGASKAFHKEMKTGPEMVKEILCRINRGDTYLRKVIEKGFYDLRGSLDGFYEALENYFEGRTCHSIDNFITTNPSVTYRKIAKIMVVAHILGYEGASETKENQKNEYFLQKQSWLSELYDYLRNEEFNNDQLNIVTFNYDRLIEHFLFLRCTTDGLSIQNLNSFAKKHIFHVYGRIGPLKFENPNNFVQYAHANNDNDTLYLASQNIELMRDNDNLGNHIETIQNLICEASEIYTIGYAFDKSNNTKLGLMKKERKSKIIANAYNKEDQDRIETSGINNREVVQHPCLKSFIKTYITNN